MILQRLKGRGTFGNVLQAGKRFSNGPLIVFYRVPEGSATLVGLSLGVGVGKKRCPKAAVRNRIKRLLRVAANQVVKDHADTLAAGEIILLWNANPGHAHEIQLEDVRPLVETLFSKIFK